MTAERAATRGTWGQLRVRLVGFGSSSHGHWSIPITCSSIGDGAIPKRSDTSSSCWPNSLHGPRRNISRDIDDQFLHLFLRQRWWRECCGCVRAASANERVVELLHAAPARLGLTLGLGLLGGFVVLAAAPAAPARLDARRSDRLTASVLTDRTDGLLSLLGHEPDWTKLQVKSAAPTYALKAAPAVGLVKCLPKI